MAHTPLPVIANVSRIVTRVVDRICGDRSDYPLLVAMACQAALKNHEVKARILFGATAWLEVLENHSVIWAGTWGKHFGFWVETESGEVIDLNTSVAHRKKDFNNPEHKPLYSPPILWSNDVPTFYRFKPEGEAEIGELLERDARWMKLVLAEINEKCQPHLLQGENEEFPNEAIICPGRKLLDDSQQSFKHFDRALSIVGIPQAPF